MENLFGRKVIYSDVAEVTAENVIEVVRKALTVHARNASEINYLYAYYKGKTPVFNRVKEVRPEICNKISINYANSIVAFKTGYLVGEPVQYVSRSADNTQNISDGLLELNGYMYAERKSCRDEELVDWQHICGTAYRMITQNTEFAEGEAPFKIYTLEPQNTFVIYSSRLGHSPLAGVYFTEDENRKRTYSVYTRNAFFEIFNSQITRAEFYPFGIIPIIEYPANNARLGAFEIVLPLLDAINDFDSSRKDAVEQFVQSLLVLKNCQLDDNVTANAIRQAGLIQLTSIGENKADIDNIAEQLDQTQNQTLKDDMYNAVLTIVGMPSQANGGTSDSSNNGAVILKNGWQDAEARAKRSETAFRESEGTMLKLVLRICRYFTDINLSVGDIGIKFTRRQYEAISEKSTVFATLMATGWVSLLDAFTISGLTIDPEEAAARGAEWHSKTEERNDEGFTSDGRVEQIVEPVDDMVPTME